jgi:O-antigen/teichoic acid export membrane protein
MTLFRLFNYGSNLFFNRLFAFIFLSLLSKYLSKDTLGQYFIFMNTQTILTTLTMVGIPYLILKELSANKNYKIFNFFTYRIVSLCFFLVFFISFVFFILLNFFYEQMPNLNLILFCSLLASFNFILYYFFVSNDRIILANLYEQILRYVLLICFFLSLIFFDYDFQITDLIFLYIFVNIVILILFLTNLLKQFNFNFKKRETNFQYKKYFKYIFLTGFFSIFNVLNHKIDLLFIDYFLDKAQVSLYGIGSQFSLIMTIPFVIFYSVLGPKISLYLKSGKIIKLNALLDFYRLILIISSLILFLILILFFENLVSFFFTAEYLEAYTIVKILTFAFFIGSFFSFNEMLLNFTGNEKKVLFSVFLSFLLNALLNVILVPKYGIIGASLSFAFSNFFFNLSIFFINFKNNFFFKYVLKILINKKFYLIKKL